MKTKTILWGMALLYSSLPILAQTGLKAEYFNGAEFNQLLMTRVDPAINFVWNYTSPAPGINPEVFSARWTGKIKAPESGEYVFRAHVDDGIRVTIDGIRIIDAWGLHDSERFNGRIVLQAGRQYNIQVEYFNAMREGEIQLFWRLPSEKPAYFGLLGTTDRLIESRFFTPPTPATVKPPVVQAKPKPAAPRPAISKPAPIAKDTLERYIPKNVLFEKSKSILSPVSEPELDRLAGFLRRYPKYRLRIEGHTDRIGNAAKNQVLSEQRAQAVADYLIAKGVTADRITTQGFGDTRPMVKEIEGVPNPVNRRVAFFILE